ncbi:MAG TPA: PRC-barrel domain-containing protein [Azospirillum sp.]|nr:PRC-barrel domain-containing protein [Azospirillum sp.]
MRTILIAAALAAALPGMALAQNSVAEKVHESPDLTTKRDPATATRPYAGDAMGRELDRLIGQRVKDPQGKDIGDVENVLVAPDGKVAGLVVEWGGLAGLGANQVAVPWRDVQVSQDGKQVTVNATRDQLEKQPKYDPDVPAAAGVDPDVKPLRR